MADTKNTITINFKAVNAPELRRAIASLDKATKSLINSQVRLAKEGKKVKDVQDKLNKSTKKTTQRTRILGGTFAVLRSKMLLFQFAMALGVRQLIKFNQQSAKVESMERAFNTLSGGASNASIAIEQLEKATNNTMSEFDLFQQANNAMILGVAKNSDEMAEMFDIAQRLGRALGRDTASSVESLITGIGRQSRLMLDNIGIIVKAEEAYESYARANNTTADALTDTQKKQAFLEATMTSAKAKISTLGEETLSSQDSLDRFKSSMSNLGSAIGDNLGFFEKLGVVFADYADNLADSIKDVSRYEEIQRKLNFELQAQIGFVESGNKSNKNAMTLSKNRVNLLLEELDALDLIDESNKRRVESEKKLAEALRIQSVAEEFNKEMSANYFSIEEQRHIFDIKVKEGIQAKTHMIWKQIEAVEELTIAQNSNFHSLNFLDAEQTFAVESVRDLGSAFAQATLHGENMGEAVVASLKAIAAELIAQAAVFSLINIFTGGSFGKATSFFQFIKGHTGGLIKENGDIQRFANGGQVRGQDNVPIMAQAGEFIIRKAVVEQVGVDNLAQLNRGEGGVGNTINVNISGGVVDESYVNNELIPALNKASSLGNRINA